MNHPLESDDVAAAIDDLRASGWTAVLVFDQFEELFAKEELFETFRAVRELSLEIDARQIPLALGFAWKTDIALPQQHPAYHLWHQLADRRRSFSISEFGAPEIARIIGRAQRALGRTLSAPLRARLVEQCQGLPWLLKKLLVHVLRRLSSAESQYLLLERELDVEHLFKEDLSLLTPEQIRCLRYVAQKAPVAVPEVEANFSGDTTNGLLGARMLVRSGMNYVIYWDIFRDYLLEERVPRIPWARTFQQNPSSSMRVLRAIGSLGKASSSQIASESGMQEGPCFNVLSDLVALQLIDRVPNDSYAIAEHLAEASEIGVARHVQAQLSRHRVYREIEGSLERGDSIGGDEWEVLFAKAQTRSSTFSPATLRSYGGTLKRWLVFAGLLEERGARIYRPAKDGRQMGLVGATVRGLFVAASSPQIVLRLLEKLGTEGGPAMRQQLARDGFRNAIADAVALGLVEATDTHVGLKGPERSPEQFREGLRHAILEADTVKVLEEGLRSSIQGDDALSVFLKNSFKATWTLVSAKRYLGGLRRFHRWALSDDTPGLFDQTSEKLVH